MCSDNFRKLRRFKQAVPEEECIKILENQDAGVLAVIGDGGYPYTVPMNYIYRNGKIYFHTAKSGHKNDAIMNNEKVSFCVVEKSDIIPDQFTSDFRSVVVFGKAKIISDLAEMRNAMEIITRKYSPKESDAAVNAKIDVRFNALAIIEMEIEHISGKESMSLSKLR